MAIPDFQTLMRPLLEAYVQRGEQPISVVREGLAEQFRLTAEEREHRLPSGTAKTFPNRVGWAATYLYRTGLLSRPRRSVYAPTDRGREVLAANPTRIDLSVLSAFPEFDEFRNASSGRVATPTAEGGIASVSTPEEQIAAAYEQLRQALIDELRERIAVMPPVAFEELVLDVLEEMGYGNGVGDSRIRTPISGDAGIDGLIHEDRLGLDTVYVQAKRWEGTVGRPVVQAFVGALQGARAAKGIVFTASSFSQDANAYAANVSPRVVLIDGAQLAGLMIDYGVGVTERETYSVKRVDTDYFDEQD